MSHPSTRSCLVSAFLCFLSLPLSDARVADRLLPRGLSNILHKEAKRDNCVYDGVYNVISTRDDQPTFCSLWNHQPNATSTVYYTPYTTSTGIYSTQVVTQVYTTRQWQTVTVTPTSTVYAKLKRAPAPTELANLKRADMVAAVQGIANAFMADSTSTSTDAIPSDYSVQSAYFMSISSACSCLITDIPYAPMFTDTVVETVPTVTRNVAGYTRTTYAPTTTVTVRTVTTIASAVTTTIGSASTAASSTMVGAVAPSDATPIGYAFNCPADDGTDQTVVYGTDIYTYKVFCGKSFASEPSFFAQAATQQSDCISQCSQADELAGAPFCKGASFDGTACSLYGTAAVSDLTNTTGIDTVILETVSGAYNATFQNNTISPSQSSQVVGSLTTYKTVITPPPSLVASVSGYSSCFTSTTFLSEENVYSWTAACSWSSGWFAAWASTAEIIYRSEAVIQASGGGATGAGAAATTAASVSATATASPSISVSVTSGVVSGAGSGATGSGGISPWTSTYTVTAENYTSTIISTGVASGASSGATGAGGILPWTSTYTVTGENYTSTIISTGGASGASSGAIGTGGVIPGPSHSTISSPTSTATVVTSGNSSGASSGSTGANGIISAWTSTYTTVISGTTQIIVVSGQVIGVAASSTGTGGVIPISSGSPNSTWLGGVTSVSVTSDMASGVSSGATGTGGIIAGPSNTTLIFESTSTLYVSGVTGGASSGATGTGGIIPVPSNTTVTTNSTITIIEASVASVLSTGAAGTGGVIPGPSGSPDSSWAGELASHSVTSGLATGVSSGATGTGGLIPIPSNITIIANSTITIVLPASTSSAASGGVTGGSFSPSNTGASRTGSQPPPGTAPTGTAPSGTGEATPPSYTSWNATTPAPSTEALGTLAPSPSSSYNGTFRPSISSRPRSGSATPSTNFTSLTESPVPSSGFPIPSGNVSISVNGTGMPTPPPTITPPGYSFNFSFPAPTSAPPTSDEVAYSSWLGELASPPPSSIPSSGLPVPTTNLSGTFSPSISERPRSGTASSPSGAPSTAVNGTLIGPSSTSACATTTVSTVTVTETLYTGCPGTCITQSVGPTLPFGYGFGAPTYSSAAAAAYSSAPAPSHSVPLPAMVRGAGKAASEMQKKAACSKVGNNIYNGEFELTTANSEPSGWGFATWSTEVIFLAYNTTDQVTLGGSHVGRVVSTDPTASATLLQPLTLCANTTYSLSGSSKVLRPLAQCTAVFALNGTTIGSVTPSTMWGTAIPNAANYTVGEAAEVDFTVEVSCIGLVSSGAPGTIDFDDLSLEKVF